MLKFNKTTPLPVVKGKLHLKVNRPGKLLYCLLVAPALIPGSEAGFI
jgi:hypothetical protein